MLLPAARLARGCCAAAARRCWRARGERLPAPSSIDIDINARAISAICIFHNLSTLPSVSGASIDSNSNTAARRKAVSAWKNYSSACYRKKAKIIGLCNILPISLPPGAQARAYLPYYTRRACGGAA